MRGAGQRVGDAVDHPDERVAGGGGNRLSEVPAEAQVTLTVAAVAARLGVAPSTLRTWDRRYGLGPSGRAAGSHRRYTADDVARLETMRRLTLAGAAPSDAARVAANRSPMLVSIESTPTATPSPAPPVFVDDLTLAAAAAKGEESRVRRMFDWVVRDRGIVGAWTDIGEPALGFLANRDPADKPGHHPEALIAGAALAAAQAVVDAHAGSPLSSAMAVLYADPRDLADHVGAHVLAAALVARGVAARVVRAGVDPARLQAHLATGQVGVFAAVGSPPGAAERARDAAEHPDLVVFLIGSRAPVVWLPGVHSVRTYEGALHEIAGVLAPREHSAGEGEARSEP